MLFTNALALILIIPSAFPSGCTSRPTVQEALKSSKNVFSGKVIARLKYGVRFRVEETWKGSPKRYIYLYTGNLRNDLDPWFEKGERWLVYASEVPLYSSENAKSPYATRLMATRCSRTAPLMSAQDEVKQLRQIARLNSL